ncbi:MAG: hypothetical protein ABIO29_06815 [Sphingomicrobium sp.]
MRNFVRNALAVGVAIAGLAVPASATHSWGGYHWARTSNPFTLKLGDNVDGSWDSYLVTTSADWTASAVLNTVIVPGTVKQARRCGATTGRVEVCNAAYGNTGWLGIASISIVSGNHISSGTVKQNDTYFNTAQYNSPTWRNMVMCQEVGHTLGLDHQDEAFDNANLNTCMDYTNNPSSNQHPNQHDYDMLATIYNHADSTTTLGQTVNRFGRQSTGLVSGESGLTMKTWGRPVHFTRDGRPDKFVRIDGPGMLTVTHVFWVPGKGPRDNRVSE